WPRAGSDWLTRAETKCPFPVVGRRRRRSPPIGCLTHDDRHPGVRSGEVFSPDSRSSSAAQSKLEEDRGVVASGAGDPAALLGSADAVGSQHVTRQDDDAGRTRRFIRRTLPSRVVAAGVPIGFESLVAVDGVTGRVLHPDRIDEGGYEAVDV